MYRWYTVYVRGVYGYMYRGYTILPLFWTNTATAKAVFACTTYRSRTAFLPTLMIRLGAPLLCQVFLTFILQIQNRLGEFCRLEGLDTQ